LGGLQEREEIFAALAQRRLQVDFESAHVGGPQGIPFGAGAHIRLKIFGRKLDVVQFAKHRDGCPREERFSVRQDAIDVQYQAVGHRGHTPAGSGTSNCIASRTGSSSASTVTGCSADLMALSGSLRPWPVR